MTFRYPTESPAESAAYWRRLRLQGTFVVVVAIIVFYAIASMPWWLVVLFTALSAATGIPAFSAWITDQRWARRLAAIGDNLRPRMIALAFAFAATILLQAIVGMTLGTWPAGILAPLAFAIEFLIARENLRTRAVNKDKQ